MANSRIGFVWFLLTLVLATTIADKSPEDCATSKRAENMVKIASQLRYELQKKSPPQLCNKFTEQVIKSAFKEEFIEARSGFTVVQYKQIIKMIEARAECFEKTSQMAGGGLRSLLLFMNKCASELETTNNSNDVQELQKVVRELQEQLAAKSSVLKLISDSMNDPAPSNPGQKDQPANSNVNKSVLDEPTALVKQVELLNKQVNNLKQVNRAQQERLDIKRDLEAIHEKTVKRLRDRLATVESELKQRIAEKEDSAREANDCWLQLTQCRNYCDLHNGR